MPNRKNYPNWFDVDDRPLKPNPPMEFIELEDVLSSIDSFEINLMDIPAGTDSLRLSCNHDVIRIYFMKQRKIINPNYERDYEYYLTNLLKYKKGLKDWKKYKKLWNEEVEKEQEKFDLKIYKKLHEKYKGKI